jgi:hypothetical protein
MSRKTIAIALTALLVAGCAQSYRPIVDLAPSQTRDRYEADLAQCRQLAEQLDPAKEAATGAIVLGVLGAALGAALGGVTHSRNTGMLAGVGGISGVFSGGAAGAGHGMGQQIQVINYCLIHRGYAVLGGGMS